jgi:glycosyl transferase, family 25
MDQLESFFRSLESYFDKIYVITLSRATDRHQHIKEELNGLHYSLFWGQDKDQFEVKDLEEQNIYNEALARKSHRWNKAMPPGMIGCSWSHKLIYEEVIKNNYNRVLILEDDIIIDKSTVSTFPQILKELPADWELLYLGYERNEEFKPVFYFKQWIYHLQRSFGFTRFSHKTIRNMYARKLTPHIYSSGYHDHTHAYAVTRSGAEKLNKLQEPIRFFPDNLLAYAATNELVKAYITRPKLINQLSQGETKSLGTYIGH